MLQLKKGPVPATAMSMLCLCLRLSLSFHSLNRYCCNRPHPFFSLFSSLAHAHNPTTVQEPSPIPQNLFIYDYLIHSLCFPEPRALMISNSFSHTRNPENPKQVVQLLKQQGFSDTHIRSSTCSSPTILFTDIEKTLQPKLHFFQQELGLSGSELGNFISKNPNLLLRSLDKTLKPRIETLKKLLAGSDCKKQDLILVLQRCYLISDTRFLSNVSYLKSCGIVGSQLIKLLVRQPRLFGKRESALRELVSRVLDMGYSIDSRMFVYAVHSVSCLSSETIMRKLQLFISFGFSEDDFKQLCRKMPHLLRKSEETLKLGIEFYMNVLNFDHKVLVRTPTYLQYSIENRVIPRYRVLQFIKSKGLLKKEPSFARILGLTEEVFREKFILQLIDNAEDLSPVCKGQLLESMGEL